MKRVILIWFIAFILTESFLVWQKISGPTYEKRFDTELEGTRIKGELLRTHSITADMPVTIHVPDEAVTATLVWRRYPTEDLWIEVPMVRDGEVRINFAATVDAEKLIKIGGVPTLVFQADIFDGLVDKTLELDSHVIVKHVEPLTAAPGSTITYTTIVPANENLWMRVNTSGSWKPRICGK